MSNIIRELRTKERMSQEELAKRASTTRQTISRIEKGEKPSFDVAMNISKVFKIPVNEIFLS
ncbi:helix-turn-helix domain-containing protein [Tissierella sp. Yu-01]|uniref:helix-turn-helix transcriptional regulator n=1 Tax=Tissierella sp. Yu-01 TaxID=3035694 RepID=UPI00240E8413|nr:helix-turn-helix domain-containing protein [Tissierella sp. Yu-01]WFA10375.1 helix-turn-helix domain-containing protein [Tissierella sp. Yu-01]